jgi:hypothetical protein
MVGLRAVQESEPLFFYIVKEPFATCLQPYQLFSLFSG